jgi:hypothetical protein
LLSNATAIDSALSYIRTNQQEQQKKHLALDSTDDDGDDDDSIDDRNGDSQLSKEEGRQTIF